MDFVPEIIDEVVILNAVNVCVAGVDCRSCAELAVGVHNWLLNCKLRYLIVDFQDEKEICRSVLTEILQLKKRLRIPFVFCGVMSEPGRLLKSYAYSDFPFYAVPEDAIKFLRSSQPSLFASPFENVKAGDPIPCTRSRTYRPDEVEEIDDGERDPES